MSLQRTQGYVLAVANVVRFGSAAAAATVAAAVATLQQQQQLGVQVSIGRERLLPGCCCST